MNFPQEGMRGGGWGWVGVLGIQSVAEGSLNELAAMDFHRRKSAEIAGEIVCAEMACFIGCFPFEQLGGDRGDRDCCLATEGLEGSAFDHFFPVLFGKLEPHPHHVATIGRADRANGIRIGHLPLILRVGQGRIDPLIKIIHRGMMGGRDQNSRANLRGGVILILQSSPPAWRFALPCRFSRVAGVRSRRSASVRSSRFPQQGNHDSLNDQFANGNEIGEIGIFGFQIGFAPGGHVSF